MSAPRPSLRPSSLKRFLEPIRAALGHAARIGFGVVVIWLLVRTGALQPRLIARAMAENPGLYALALLLYLVPLQVLACGRWYWLLRASNVSIRLRTVIRLHLMGLFFSGFLPGGTGGDLVKGYYLLKGRSKAEGAAALGTLVVDRIVGLLGLVGLAAIAVLTHVSVWRGSPMLGAQAGITLAAAAGGALITLAYLSPWTPRWLPAPARAGHAAQPNARGFLSELAGALSAFRKAPRVFVGGILISAAVHFILVIIYALCAHALGVDLPFGLHAYVGPTLTFVNGIPISPAGLGVGEAAGKVLYTAVGATHGQAEIPALVHTFALITSLLAAPAYFLRGRRKA
jgi:uncharacterized membrane protein YbhN (UPF0104 family)